MMMMLKLSERLFIPSNRLRGFEKGKVGPKDNDDYIGGNYITALNLSTQFTKIFSKFGKFRFFIFYRY